MVADRRLLEIADQIVEGANERLHYLRRSNAPDETITAQGNLTRTYSNRLSKYAPFDGTNYLCPKCAIEDGAQTVIRQAGSGDQTLWQCDKGHKLALVEPDE